MLEKCVKCAKETDRIKYFVPPNAWFCVDCKKPEPISFPNLHMRVKLFRKHITRARANSIKDRIRSKDDGRTVIYASSGRPVSEVCW